MLTDLSLQARSRGRVRTVSEHDVAVVAAQARPVHNKSVGELELQGEDKGRLIIRMNGRLDQQLGRDLRDAIESHLAGSEPVLGVVMDLRGLEDYDILGRAELIAAHRLLLSRKRRFAYVANRTRIRGLAILTIQELQDPNARSVATLEHADGWLGDRVSHGDVAGADVEQGIERKA